MMLVLLMWGGAGRLKAQVFSNTKNNPTVLSGNQRIVPDTTKKAASKTNDKITIWYSLIHDSTKRALDSSIRYLHRNPLIGVFDVDLGNTGSSVNSLRFQPNMSPAMNLGWTSYTPYLYHWDSLAFYNTTRPYTDIYYRLGTKQEQMIELMHTQNVKPNWNIAAQYRKIGSPGFYKYQRTNHDNLAFTTNYSSVDQHYHLKAGIIYNKWQQDENGGIEDEQYLSSIKYNDKQLVPVNIDGKSSTRSSVANYFRSVSFHLDHQYELGKTDSIYNADSTGLIARFKPVFGIRHNLYLDFNYHRFKDLTPVAEDYSRLGNYSFADYDSLQIKYAQRVIGNTFTLNGNIYWRDQVLQVEGGYGLEIETPSNGPYRQTYSNSFLVGTLEKPMRHERDWLLKALLKSYFTGNAKGNFLIDAKARKRVGRDLGEIEIGFAQSLQSAPYNYLQYGSNYFHFTQTFSKVSQTHIYGAIRLPKWKLNVGGHYYLLGNYIYRDTNWVSQQYKKVFPLLRIDVNKILNWRHWYLDNQMVFQVVDETAPIHVPLFASRHRFAYEHRLFKQKLGLASGVEMRWNSPYLADEYSPVWNSFVSQYTRHVWNYPQWSVFFNFKVKRFRASVALDEVQQLGTANHINYAGYGAQNFAFRFGFHWAMVN